jgi:hypothetical protein
MMLRMSRVAGHSSARSSVEAVPTSSRNLEVRWCAFLVSHSQVSQAAVHSRLGTAMECVGR